ncbi:MAG: sigma-70 family RNA polymerase sigma factor [Clostridiales bacterium]|nr:sigma-70 family RNA polymerase sigma factor [Clostridiales bacterium]
MADDAFLNKLYHEYYTSIFSYCVAMLEGDEEDAADCTNAVFEQAKKSISTLEKHPNVIGWLKVTAQYRVKRALRKRGRKQKREIYIDDASERYISALQYVHDFEEESYNEIDIEKTKDLILGKLTQDEFELYSLRFEKKLTIKEVAEAISLSESATRMRLVKLELKIKEIISRLNL